MKLWGKMTPIFDRTVGLLALLGCLSLVFIMLIVNAEVVMRYLLNRPILWATQITEYGLLWLTFLGTAWLLRKEGHVKMDIVLSQLNPKTQSVLNIITSIIGAVACLTLAWYGTQITWQYFQEGRRELSILSFALAPIMVIIPIGAFLLFVQFLRRTYGYFLGLGARDKQDLKTKAVDKPEIEL